MKQHVQRFYGVGTVILLLLLLLAPHTLRARAEGAPKLVIDQIKITTDEQFVRIHNIGPVVADFSSYQLVYLNSDNKPTKTFTFTGSIPPDGYYLLSDAQVNACYQMQIESASLGFSTTGGSLQLWQATSAITMNLTSSVVWIKNSKTAPPAGTQMLPAATTAFLQRQNPIPANSTEWQAVQPKADNPCALVLVADTTKAAPDSTLHLTPGSVPTVSVSTTSESNETTKNIDMLAPVINELLPNPGSPKTDAEDEFFELYNPNDADFDLGGYKFYYGSTTPKAYTFPAGTILQPRSYTAFFSSGTSVSLSNTSGQAWLTDAAGNVLSLTDVYGAAKDNQSWSLANGKWIWMATPTPGAANNGASAPVASSTKNGTKVPTPSGSVKSSSTGTPSGSGSAAQDLKDASPIHPLILAGIGTAAVGYALYEYRHDISNKFLKLRRHARSR